MKYIAGDIKAQSKAVEIMKSEFLSLLWNQGYEGHKERYERINEALEKCGQGLDSRFVSALFYQLEDVARDHIKKLVYLIETTNPKALKNSFPDIPDALIEIAEDVRTEETRLKQQKARWDRELRRDGTPEFSAKKYIHAEWLKWQHHKTVTYSSNEDFASKMTAKFPDPKDEEGFLVKHSTITRKWISEWKMELGIFNDWIIWKENQNLYPGLGMFCIAMLDKHLTNEAKDKKEERRRLHYKIANYLIPEWETDKSSPYLVE